MTLKPKSKVGFTIVELLIVIVVIAILAAISIVAYNGIQSRARDTIRSQDMTSIRKALISFDIRYGGVNRPGGGSYTGTYYYGGWDSSTSPNWLSFLRSDFGNMPTDPTNTRTTSNAPDTVNRNYYYYCYNQGSGPAPATANVALGYMKDSGARVDYSIQVNSCI